MIRSIKKSLYSLYLNTNKSLGITEKWYAGNHSDAVLPFRTIFILGAPRCGSTLLYQAMAAAFDLCFISNAHCFLFGAPWFTELLLHPSRHYQDPNYRSRYGAVKGAHAPSECGNFWYRFFPRKPQYAPLEKCDPNKLKALRTSIRALTKAAQKPLLIKNLVCGLRLEALLHTLPEALFIVLHRKEVDIAHSILESRKKLLGSYEAWFSLEPPDIDELQSMPVVGQVVGQIRSVYRLIDDAEKKEPTHFHHVAYEDFCLNPTEELNKIHAFLSRNNTEVAVNKPWPDSFEQRSGIRIDKELYNGLLHYIKKQN